MKKCAIFLPVYNGENFLKETIESVLNQSYKDFDLIIYNDGSTDNSNTIVSNFLKDNRITYINNKENHGAGLAFYSMFSKYNNYEYIGMLGQDDVLSKNYLESQIDTLENSEAIVSFSKVKYIDDNNNEIIVDMYHHDLIKSYDRGEFMLVLLHQNHLCASSSIIKNKSISNIQNYTGYNNDRLQDHELWINLLTFGSFIFNENTQILYRKHNNNLSDPTYRINQNKLEYNNMVTRLLFSKHFLSFAKTQNDCTLFLERIVRELVYKAEEYGNPIITTIINFCEKILLIQLGNDYICEALSDLYLQSGLIQKYLQQSKYKKFLYPIFINLTPELQNLLNCNNLFELDPNIAKFKKLISLNVYYKESFNDTNNIKAPAIIITNAEKNYIRNGVLIISDINNCKDDIITYIQDHACVYANELFPNNHKLNILQNTIYDLREEHNKILNENNILTNKLNIVYGSRSWKLIQKLRGRN